MNWKPLYRLGALAALTMLALIPVQTAVYFVTPPPSTVAGFFDLFTRSNALGLLSLDLIYMVDIVLAALLLMTVIVALRRTAVWALAVAQFLNVAAMTMYFASNPAFEMLSLSKRYAAATTDAHRAHFLAAGEAMLATYTGTAYNVSYVLAACAGLIVAAVMLRSDRFSKTAAWLGVVMNVLGLVPPSVGIVGLVASLLFLVPFLMWLVFVAKRLFELAREQPAARPLQGAEACAPSAAS